MDQILLALEKVGITGEVLKMAAIVVSAFTGIIGGAVAIAAATKNWPERRWERAHVPVLIFLTMLGPLLMFGKPPASYGGAFLVILALAWGIAHSFRRKYIHS